MVDFETKNNIILSVIALTNIKLIRNTLILQINLPTRIST